MKKAEIKVGGMYLAKISGVIVTVRVNAIRDSIQARNKSVTVYDVTNLRTGRKTTFRSAAKFRGPSVSSARPNSGGLTAPPTISVEEGDRLLADIQGGEHSPDPTLAIASTATVPSRMSPATSATGTSLAGSLAAARQPTRRVGNPVAGMVPNTEQESILTAAVGAGLKALVIGAGAGTGKTATLKMLEQVLPGRGQYTAFNSALVAESKAKFRKVAVNTTHSLAFRAVGKAYQHRLGGERMRSGEVARRLGIEDFVVTLRGQGAPDAEGKPTDKPRTLKAEFLAGQVIVAVRRFCQSADREITAGHFGYIDGIDGVDADGQRGRENNDRVREYLLLAAHRMWADITRVDGSLPFSHDCYVKLWQLGEGDDRPIIAADYILLDEAQDTAPVFLDILKQQEHALLVFVGDSNQAIYEWRGAVDAMRAYPDAERRMLSQSYRFGQAVADVANAVLATLEEPTDLVMRGNPAIASRVEEVASPRCYLYRTNAGAVGRVMLAIEAGKRPHLIGGGADVVAWCQAAIDLQARRGTRHPELCCFETWSEVEEYAKSDEGSDLRLMVKLVTEFGASRIRDALRDMPKEEDADLVVSTAHKSKGREWDTVRLGPDFPTANKMTDADRRLLYVALTRAKLVLDITECPPFCGGEDLVWGEAGLEARWVPGIKITYTQPMPTEEQVVAPKVDSIPVANVATATTKEDSNVTTTYTKLRDESWGIRAEGTLTAGQRVQVRKKSGEVKTETIGRIVWSGNGVTLATIASGSGDARDRNTRQPRQPRQPGQYEHTCRNGHDPHQGPCCTGRHRGGDDCGADCCEMD